jgi:hypothetical protein
MYPLENSYYPYWGLFLVLCSSCAVLVHFLQPIDSKWSTKKWAMPPKPPGVPVLGNLLQMMQARRRGAVSFNDWVSFWETPSNMREREAYWFNCPAAGLFDSVWGDGDAAYGVPDMGCAQL